MNKNQPTVSVKIKTSTLKKIKHHIKTTGQTIYGFIEIATTEKIHNDKLD